MSVNLKTKIVLKGTEEELAAMLEVIKRYATENPERFHLRHDCCYLEKVHVQATGGRDFPLRPMKPDEIRRYLASSDGTVTVTSNGPYGTFSELTDVILFEEVAEAAPHAEFTGTMDGCITPAYVSCHGTLKDGKLYLSAFHETEMQWMESGVENYEQQAVFDPITRVYHI